MTLPFSRGLTWQPNQQRNERKEKESIKFISASAHDPRLCVAMNHTRNNGSAFKRLVDDRKKKLKQKLRFGTTVQTTRVHSRNMSIINGAARRWHWRSERSEENIWFTFFFSKICSVFSRWIIVLLFGSVFHIYVTHYCRRRACA